MNIQTSSLNCTLVSCRQEMVRSPQFNLFLFSKMTRRCNLKTCSYFDEVDNMQNMQMICEWTHENILKQWGISFSKQLEMPGSTYRYQGPKQTSWRTYQVLRNSVIAFSLRSKGLLMLTRNMYPYICTDQRDNWNLSGPSSIAGGPKPVIEACSYFFQRGSQKY